MGLINRNGRYYAEFYDATRDPASKRFSLRTTRKEEARRKLVALEEAWKSEEFDPWTDNPRTYKQKQERKVDLPKTLAGALELFLEQKQKAGRTDNTLRTYREVVSQLCSTIGGGTGLERITARQIEQTFRVSELSAATRHKRFGHFRTFFRWAQKEGLVRSNPIDDVEPPRKPQKLPKAVTEEELQAVCIALLMDYQEKHEKGQAQDGELAWRVPLMLFAFCTGMRASELARLQWGHLDFDKRLITIRKQKNHKEQTIPLNSQAVTVLEMVPKGEAEDYVFAPPGKANKERTVRPFVEKASKAFREARKAAGIKRRISFHGLRHGFCSKLAEAGKPLYVIKEAARHADVSTSLIYVHMANEHLKSELDDVFA